MPVFILMEHMMFSGMRISLVNFFNPYLGICLILSLWGGNNLYYS